jgi:serine/threonine protein kinase
MIRVSSADLDENEATDSPNDKEIWDPKYFWNPPSESQLPCTIEEFERFRIEGGGFSADVTNLTVVRDESGRATLAWNHNKPYEPEDTNLRSAYRSAKYLMDVEDLGCDVIQERDIIVQEQISGLTTQVLHRGQTCVQKKLPLAPVHLKPFLYEMQALYKLQGCEGIIDFVGVEVDNEKKELLGYLRSCDEMVLATRLGLGATRQGRIPWSERERWAKQIVAGVFHAHSRGIVIGTLDPNNIGIHPTQGARLHHVSHGRCEVGSGCLAPELRRLEGRDLTDADMNARQDIFALGLVLWVLAQTDLGEEVVVDAREKGLKPWWKRLLCKKSRLKCQYGDVPLERNFCQETHKDPVDLPTCRSHIPDWYKLAIMLCRSHEPCNRPTAKKLLKVFTHKSWNSTAQKRRDSALE